MVFSKSAIQKTYSYIILDVGIPNFISLVINFVTISSNKYVIVIILLQGRSSYLHLCTVMISFANFYKILHYFYIVCIN